MSIWFDWYWKLCFYLCTLGGNYDVSYNSFRYSRNTNAICYSSKYFIIIKKRNSKKNWRRMPHFSVLPLKIDSKQKNNLETNEICEMNNKSVSAFHCFVLFSSSAKCRISWFREFTVRKPKYINGGTPLMPTKKHMAEIHPILTCKNAMLPHANPFYVSLTQLCAAFMCMYAEHASKLVCSFRWFCRGAHQLYI